MARYINADKLIEGRVENDPVVIAANCAPTANVKEVVYGEWDDESICSVCGCGVTPWNAMNYCPNCGAKMDGGEKF